MPQIPGKSKPVPPITYDSYLTLTSEPSVDAAAVPDVEPVPSTAPKTSKES